MKDVVASGIANAEPQWAHSVHVEVAGLQPARSYWYRFRAGDAQTAPAHARTAPAAGANPARLRFAFASCAQYEQGFFGAYAQIAADAQDLVVHLGDYIYESSWGRDHVRKHNARQPITLDDYRARYALYKSDADLQAAHASAPWLITWDDHEVQNDYANEWSQNFVDPQQFLKRRAAAYQAFYEHMPLRPSLSRPKGAALRLYERFAFGDLVEFSRLDGRQYRSREACYGPPDHGGGHVESDASCAERLDPARSMLGAEQEAWLADGLAHSRARWNVLAQDVMMAQLRERQADGSTAFWTDDWNGYPANRRRLLQQIHDTQTRNPVVLGGDIHSFWANDLKLDFDDPRSPAVAAELIATSITAHPPPYEKFAAYLADNPHVRFFDSRWRGYLSIDVTPQRLTSRCQVVSDAADPAATLSTLATFVVEDGKPGVARG